MKITLKMLTELGACPAAIARFQVVFGEEVEVTEENATKAIENGLYGNAWFLSQNLLNTDGRRVYANMGAELEHSGYAAGPDCPGCRGELKNFVKLYNQEEYRE